MSKPISIIIAAGLKAGPARLGINGRFKDFPRGKPIEVTEDDLEALNNSSEEYTLVETPEAVEEAVQAEIPEAPEGEISPAALEEPVQGVESEAENAGEGELGASAPETVEQTGEGEA